jgi:hypothetical protein
MATSLAYAAIEVLLPDNWIAGRPSCDKRKTKMKKGYFVNNEIYHDAIIYAPPIIYLTGDPATPYEWLDI